MHTEENIMVTLKEAMQCSNQRYLDFKCSMYITGRKYYFVIINHAMKNKVKFVDDTTISAKGIGDI